MPLMPQDITGVVNQQTAALNAQGKLVPVRRTEFRVRGQGPFVVELPVDGWTADKADKAIREIAEQIITLCDKYPG